MNRQRYGFSMVELLVIIALIVLLISLLMPALRQARERAWVANCSSNLRQIGIAMSAYATTHKDYFPYMEITSSGLFTYSDWLTKAGVVKALADEDKKVQSIFVCPEYEMPIYSSQYSNYKTTYSINLWITGYLQNPGWIFPRVRRSLIRKPHALPLIGDGVYQMPAPSLPAHHVYLNFTSNFEIGKYHTDPDRYTPSKWVRYAHLDSPQAAFVDGHVEQRPGPWSGVPRP